jgi:hypothetical protein
MWKKNSTAHMALKINDPQKEIGARKAWEVSK